MAGRVALTPHPHITCMVIRARKKCVSNDRQSGTQSGWYCVRRLWLCGRREGGGQTTLTIGGRDSATDKNYGNVAIIIMLI